MNLLSFLALERFDHGLQYYRAALVLSIDTTQYSRVLTSRKNGRAVARSEPALFAGDFGAVVMYLCHTPNIGKGNAMLLLISSILPWIPFDLDHTHNTFTSYVAVNGA